MWTKSGEVCLCLCLCIAFRDGPKARLHRESLCPINHDAWQAESLKSPLGILAKPLELEFVHSLFSRVELQTEMPSSVLQLFPLSADNSDRTFKGNTRRMRRDSCGKKNGFVYALMFNFQWWEILAGLGLNSPPVITSIISICWTLFNLIRLL